MIYIRSHFTSVVPRSFRLEAVQRLNRTTTTREAERERRREREAVPLAWLGL
jgi:hypothetical protein